MAVHLTRIYTRTGDAGQTRLGDLSKTAKTDPRVAAYGDVNEANAVIGVALAAGGLPDELCRVLLLIQNELFDVGADLATPVISDPKHPPLRITQDYIDRLEGWCDEFSAQLAELRSFILPGGSVGSAYLHLACTSVRRAERSGWLAAADAGDELDQTAVSYLNRLSDLLFIMARYANIDAGGDVLWVPGGERD